MSDLEVHDDKRNIIYTVAAIVLIALVVVGLVAYRGHKTSVRADESRTSKRFPWS